MKNAILILSFSSSFFSLSQHAACAKQHLDFTASSRSATLSLAYIGLTEKYDVHFYFLDVALERTSTDVAGSVEIHADAVAPVLDTFLFELHADLDISDILLNGVTSTPFTRIGSAVIVPCSFVAGESFFYKVLYFGTPPDAASSAFGAAAMTNDFSPSWGNQVTWSLTQPFSAYEWFPCKQSLTDKADSVWVFVTTSNENMAGSQGVLTAVTDMGGGLDRYEWKSNYTTDYYLISVAVAEYVEYTVFANPVGASGPIPVQNFVYNNPGTLPFFVDEIDNTADMIEYFSDLYGLYPFELEKYGHCMAPIGGGMEHQTMTTLGYFQDWLTAHELGHQWFGDHVTCGSWADIWVNEGFASYSEELMNEVFHPGDEAISMQDRHDDIMSEPDGAVWCEDSLNPSRIFDGRLTYNKGAAIIHTLRFLIDDDNLFFQVLKDYQSAYALSTAKGDDFHAVAESTTAMNFEAFFNEWYYGEGFPTYGIEYIKIGDTLFIQLNQSTSMPSVTPVYTNDLEIRVVGTGTANQIVRLTGIDANVTVHSIYFTEDVESISIDPLNWVINDDGPIFENLSGLPGVSEALYSVFPNPAQTELTLKSEVDCSVRLINLQGEMLGSLDLISGTNHIDVSRLRSGQYYIVGPSGIAGFVKE